MAREIMYIGRKPQKVDNKNNIPTRIWRGLGQVIGGIPDLEAEKLKAHPDIWLDVTSMAEKQRRATISAFQAQYLAEQRRARENQEITLTLATEEELEAEIKKRRANRGKAVENEIDPKLVPLMPAKGSQGNENDPRERPNNTDDLGADIFGVLVQLDSEKDFDGEGRPYLERVNEKLGYSVTQAELDSVWKAYNEPVVKGGK